ncbi:MAG: hypothetical protein CMM84_03720 [Rhodothermaceae bacterium]|nr:hypothetical protein [Rhodothermaceae bacterium]MBC15325.1 hypothetical protein [Rhodothermaceae bacterium]
MSALLGIVTEHHPSGTAVRLRVPDASAEGYLTPWLPVARMAAPAPGGDGAAVSGLPPLGSQAVAVVTADPEHGAALAGVVVGIVPTLDASLPGHGGMPPGATALASGAWAWAAPDGTRIAYDPEGGVEVDSPAPVVVRSEAGVYLGGIEGSQPLALGRDTEARIARLENALTTHKHAGVGQPPTPDTAALLARPAPILSDHSHST